MDRLHPVAAVLLSVLMTASCASSGKTSHPSDSGAHVLKAIVTEREFSGPGTAGGGSMRGSGSWYLSFEAQDGDKIVHYRFQVTQQQYFRYPEGSSVEIVVGDNELHEIRSAQD